MNDAFENEIGIGTKVLYSVGNGGSRTMYVIGEVTKLYPHVPNPDLSKYTPPDRVAIKPLKTTREIEFSKDPILYASNVVKWED